MPRAVDNVTLHIRRAGCCEDAMSGKEDKIDRVPAPPSLPRQKEKVSACALVQKISYILASVSYDLYFVII